MVASVFFNNFSSYAEQNLIEDLIIESIRIYGHDLYYLPRTLVNKDDIYGEDPVSEYKNAYLVEMYIKSYDGYEGDGSFLSKFNLEIRDQTTFTLAMRSFNDEIGQYESIDRPREGDLLYSPMMKRMFAIQYVNNKPVFYQMGALQMYDMTCEVWEYSNEKFSTGVAVIDEIEAQYSINEQNYAILADRNVTLQDENGYDLVQDQFDYDEQNQDVYADNDEFDLESDGLIDWTEKDPFSMGNI